MSTRVTMETWILSASAKLGGIELVDHLNKGKKVIGFLLFVRSEIMMEIKRLEILIDSI